jgi:hypothetical protein
MASQTQLLRFQPDADTAAAAAAAAAEDIYDPVRKSMLIVQGFNDEMREVRPGFLLGEFTAVIASTDGGVGFTIEVFKG